MNARVYVCMCMRGYVSMFVCVYICVLMCECVCVYVSVWVYVSACMCVCVCAYVLTNLYLPWCILHIDLWPFPPPPLCPSLRRRGGPVPETKEGPADGDCVMARQRHLDMDRG